MVGRLKFVVIENSKETLYDIVDILKKAKFDGFEVVEIWPSVDIQNSLFTSWDSAWEKIADLRHIGFDPDRSCVILLLDIALGRKTQAIEEGVAAIRRRLNKPNFEEFVKIAVTDYAPNAKALLDYGLDHVIFKDNLIGFSSGMGSSRRRSVEFLEFSIRNALVRWRARTGRIVDIPANRNVRLLDSPGARRVEIGLGREALDLLASRIAADWDGVEFDVLSGGYSGAFLLRASDSHGSHQVVCKIGNSHAVLKQEVECWKLMLATPAFANLAVQMDSEIYPLIDDIEFIKQASIIGPTFEDAVLLSISRVLAGKETLGQAGEMVKSVLGPIARACAETTSQSIDSCPRFDLNSVDIERFVSSREVLAGLRDQCVARGFLCDHDWHHRAAIEAFDDCVVAKWGHLLMRTGKFPIMVALQHGDLNPRNVLVWQGSPRLIDFARFGEWPVGYDLVRLELQILLRVMGTHQGMDVFPNYLVKWLRVWTEIEAECIGNATMDVESSGVLGLVLNNIVEAMKTLRTAFPGTQEDFQKHISLVRCFDAIKMCSYQDASSFKQLFFLLVALKSARKAGLIV